MSNIIERSRFMQPGNLVTLYELDLSPQGAEPPDTPIYLHPYSNLEGGTLPFMGNTFNPYPISSEGWDWSTKGVLPRPTVIIGNLGGIATALLERYGDFVGCIVTKRQTYTQYLDSGAEPGSPGAYQQYPIEVYSIERKVDETPTYVQFELSAPWDTEGVFLPRRQVLDYCAWIYRGPECSYVGPPVTDKDGHPITATTDRGAYNATTTYAAGDYTYVMLNGIRIYFVSLANANTASLTDKTKWVRDDCPKKTATGCKPRFGATNPLPYGGFPGVGKIPAQ